MPPASETATTKSTGAPVVSPIKVGPMPAAMMGYSIPSMSQSFVRSTLLAITKNPLSIADCGFQIQKDTP
jgi:hypothetical protein